MKKNLFVLFAVCLSILAAVIPVAGSTDGGAVTIVQPTEGAYSIGDTLTFSGTNNASGTTYLFITGPNLNAKGSEIQSKNPHSSPVTDGDTSTFQAISGFAGDKWLWEWNTKDVLIDAGMYTVYAASTPRDLPHVNSTHFDTVTVVMKRPAGSSATSGAGSGGIAAEAGGTASVTITQPKSGRYSIGDTLTFSGTNTGSGTTYLFITGPNLDAKGAQIQSTHPGNAPVIDNNASTFLAAAVGPDHQWSYTWNSQKALIDAGMYEVFAAGSPRDLPHINDTQYARVAFIMARPANIESAAGNLSVPPSVVMKGDKITISGTAQGSPAPGVAIWVIGAPGSDKAGYANQFIVNPDPAGSYSLDLDRATTGLEEGRFHVVVQHPMENNVFDICLANSTAGDTTDAWVLNRMLRDSNNPDGTRVFKIQGAGSLQGDDAWEALVQVFVDPAVDDSIVIFPSTVNPAGSGDTVPGQQDQTRETPAPLAGGQDTKTTGSGSLLDQVFGFLSGIF